MTLTDEDIAIAQTMLNHLGGKRLQLMTGAYGFSYDRDERTLKFRFQGSLIANCIKITLDADNTYSLEFWLIQGTNCTLAEQYDEVYFDQLIDIFESTTGLALRLGRMIFTGNH